MYESSQRFRGGQRKFKFRELFWNIFRFFLILSIHILPFSRNPLFDSSNWVKEVEISVIFCVVEYNFELLLYTSFLMAIFWVKILMLLGVLARGTIKHDSFIVYYWARSRLVPSFLNPLPEQRSYYLESCKILSPLPLLKAAKITRTYGLLLSPSSWIQSQADVVLLEQEPGTTHLNFRPEAAKSTDRWKPFSFCFFFFVYFVVKF